MNEERAALSVVPADPVLATVKLSEIEMRSIYWIERPLVLGDSFTLVAGRKGVGKGTWLAMQIGKMTSGLWGIEKRNALIVSSEDSAAIDLGPRCKAAGADMDRVIVVRDHFTLPRDKKKLHDTALSIGEVGMIVIDPMANHLNGANTDNEGNVRAAIGDMNRLADKLGCVIFGVRHLGKSVDRGAVESVLGSQAWTALPRAVLAFAADDEDDMVFHVQMAAGNRSGRDAGCSYRMELADVGLLEPVTRAVLTGVSGKNVDDLLQSGRRASKSGVARDMLLDYLDEHGDTPSEVLDAAIAQAAGITAKTVRNLRGEIKDDGLIRAYKDGEVWKVARTLAPR